LGYGGYTGLGVFGIHRFGKGVPGMIIREEVMGKADRKKTGLRLREV